MKNQIAALLETPMDRKSFLQNIGLGIIMFFGIANMLDAFSGIQSKSNTAGYGSTGYGK